MPKRFTKAFTSLRSSKDFDLAKKSCIRLRRGFAQIVLLPRQTTHEIRLGLVVSKKVGCSPERNRVKRRYRSLLQACLAQRKSRAGFDLLLIAYPKQSHFLFAEAVQQLLEVIQRYAK